MTESGPNLRLRISIVPLAKGEAGGAPGDSEGSTGFGSSFSTDGVIAFQTDADAAPGQTGDVYHLTIVGTSSVPEPSPAALSNIETCGI